MAGYYERKEIRRAGLFDDCVQFFAKCLNRLTDREQSRPPEGKQKRKTASIDGDLFAMQPVV